MQYDSRPRQHQLNIIRLILLIELTSTLDERTRRVLDRVKTESMSSLLTSSNNPLGHLVGGDGWH